jgi:glycosyltransferase involved in cell wall biosynthesis
MRILFITAGICATRGLSNTYQESLMEGLVGRGHQVACLCTAEVSGQPGVSWACRQREPYPLYAVFNGGVYPALYPQGGIGSRDPLRDAQGSPALRRAILEIVRAEQPDVVSIQSLFGLPFDVVDAIQHEGIPVVFTAHDYFVLCPTAHLFLPAGQPCRLTDADLVCARCCRTAPSYRAFRQAWQLDRLAARFDSRPIVRNAIWRVRNVLKRIDGGLPGPGKPAAYSARRRQAIRFLNRLAVLHCISRCQAGVFRQICGPLPNVRVLPLMPPSLETAVPVPRLRDRNPNISFAALNINGAFKGSQLLAEAFQRLARTGAACELHVYGNWQPGPAIPRVSYHGRYQSADLDRIAARSDFCIVPSVGDETLGFTGLEMLARGVPLIASNRAGVGDFIADGRNGLLFDPASADSLCVAIEKAMQPACTVRRGGEPASEFPLRSFTGHVQDMENLFREASRNRPEPQAATICR